MNQNEIGQPAKANKYVGQPMDRVDGRLKVTGRAKYAGEFALPHLAHAVLVQSTIAKGRVTHVDSAAAERAPGVLAVITHARMPVVSRPTVPPSGQSVPLLNEEIVYSGQNVAVVVAESIEQARRAAELVIVKYEDEKPSTNLEANLASAFVPGATGRQPISKRGDAEAGLAQGSSNVDQVYRTPIEHHNPMEMHATIAYWPDDQHVMVYDATQGVFNSARNVAEQFNLPPENVHLVDPFVGGGFGCKGQSWPHVPLAVMASKVVKRPVKLELTRRQMFTSNGHRPETRQALKIASGPDGKLTGIHAEMVNSTSRLDTFLEPTGQDSSLTYSCSNVLVRHQVVRLDKPAPTYMRAPGEASGSFSIESAIDELAHQLQVDPLELRLRNYAEIDESKRRPFSSKSLKECYAQGAQEFGWSSRHVRTASEVNGPLIGYGMATATYPANFRPAAAKARITDDGAVLVQCGTQDLGTGTYTILTQIAADALSIPPSRIRVEIADTKLPQAPGSGGSTSAASAGSAVHTACEALREALTTMTTERVDSPLYNLQPTELVITDGIIRAKKDPSKAMSYQQILKSVGKKIVEQEGSASPGLERGPRGNSTTPEGNNSGSGGNGYTMQGFGAQFCEVHIDRDLKTLRVARWVGAFALGTVANEKTLTSQLYGGIIFGIGMALMEESLMDDRYGRFVNSNLAEYHVPVHKDVPDMKVILVPEKDTLVNPVGIKGGGEIGITGVAAAIANAVFDATGKRVRELPITLDKLL